MIAVHLSASLVKDFLSCPKKAYYRINRTGQSEQTTEMAVGSLVHEVLEKNWLERKAALGTAATLVDTYGLPGEIIKANKMINSFFDMFPQGFFSEDDSIESYFKVPYRKDVLLTGKIDRIHNGIVYDWKTGSSPPDDINRDPQFIIYYMAYKRLYKTEPKTLCYVSLSNKRIYYFTPIKEVIEEFEDLVIPSIVSSIRDNRFPRNGMFDYRICQREYPKYRCPFQNVCWPELGIKV
jgi:CRISPR/Cas system-associated exonuclease Cas4 (RecB family)